VPAPPPVAVAPAAAALATLEGGLERVARELLRQQRTDRRWRVFFRLAWLGLAVAVAWALFAQRTHTPTSTKPHTALVEVQGEIAAGNEASAELLVSALKSAFEDTGAVAVVLRINSPGGSPVQSGIVNDEIRRLKACTRRRSTPWSRRCAPRAPTTSRWRPTRSTSTRPAWWAASAC
jgi:protease-4